MDVIDQYTVTRIISENLGKLNSDQRYLDMYGNLGRLFQKSLCKSDGFVRVYIEINIMSGDRNRRVKIRELEKKKDVKSDLKVERKPDETHYTFFLEEQKISPRMIQNYTLEILIGLSDKCIFQTLTILRKRYGFTLEHVPTLVFELTYANYMEVLENVEIQGRICGDINYAKTPRNVKTQDII